MALQKPSSVGALKHMSRPCPRLGRTSAFESFFSEVDDALWARSKTASSTGFSFAEQSAVFSVVEPLHNLWTEGIGASLGRS